MTNNPSKNIWDEFTKTSKIGPSMESLNADFFQFSAKIINSYLEYINMSSYLGIRL